MGVLVVMGHALSNIHKVVTGIDDGNISKCCLGNLKSAGGYIWRYASEW